MKSSSKLLIFSLLVIFSSSAIVPPLEKQVKHKRQFIISTDVQSRTGCLDQHGGGEAQAYPCNGGDYQRWWVKQAGGGWIYIQSLRSGNVLDSNSDGSAYTLPINGGQFQHWKWVSGNLLLNRATGRFLIRKTFSDTVATKSGSGDAWSFDETTPEFDCPEMDGSIGNLNGVLVNGKDFSQTCWSIEYWGNPTGGVTIGAQCWTNDRTSSRWSTIDSNIFQKCL